VDLLHLRNCFSFDREFADAGVNIDTGQQRVLRAMESEDKREEELAGHDAPEFV
jgi:hypothetical protein